MLRSILSLSKIAHQIWRHQPIGQRKMTTERAVELGFGADREVVLRGGVDKKKRSGGRQ